jgi:Anti-sigma-K factor rskA
MTEHEYWDELAAGYALHGLSPDEEIVFADHLETCEICADSVKDHELVAAQLGSIAHYREADDDAPSWESMRASIVGARPEAPVADLAAHRRRYAVSRRVLAVAAAVVVVAGGGVATWQLSTGGTSCSASSGCHMIRLDAAGGTMEASVVVRNRSVTVTPSGMTAAPAGKVWVLWQLPRDGSATPIGAFTTGGNTAVTTKGLTAAYSDTEAFAISEENAAAAPYSTPSNNLAEGVAS